MSDEMILTDEQVLHLEAILKRLESGKRYTVEGPASGVCNAANGFGRGCPACPARGVDRVFPGHSCFLRTDFSGVRIDEIQKVLGTYVPPTPLTNQEIADKFGIKVEDLIVAKED